MIRSASVGHLRCSEESQHHTVVMGSVPRVDMDQIKAHFTLTLFVQWPYYSLTFCKERQIIDYYFHDHRSALKGFLFWNLKYCLKKNVFFLGSSCFSSGFCLYIYVSCSGSHTSLLRPMFWLQLMDWLVLWFIEWKYMHIYINFP